MNEHELKGEFDQLNQYYRSSVEQRSLISVTGKRLSLDIYHPGLPYVLVISPGRKESAKKYMELAWDLKNLPGFTIVVVDHIGQGKADRLLDDPHKGHIDRFEHYLQDFQSVLNFIESDLQPKKVVVFGHSMGGAIATLALGQKHIKNVVAVVLGSPMFQIQTAPYPLAVARLLARGGSWLGLGDRYALGQGPAKANPLFKGNDLTSSEVRFWYMHEIWRQSPELMVGGPTYRWVAQAFRVPRMLEESPWYYPTTLIQAGADQVVQSNAQVQWCDRFHQLCQLKRINGAQHEVFMERDQFRIPALQILKDVLNDVSGR